METASLIIKVDSRGAESASRDLDKLTGASGRAEGKVGLLTGAYKAFAAVAASAALVKTVGTYVRLADESANMSARLRLVTKSQEEFNTAHAATFEIAQRNSAELGAINELYVRLAQNSDELAGNQGRLLGLTEAISQAMVVSGASTSESASAIRQFTQAVASGVLRGDEFNSIMENAPRLARALADGLGVPVGALRKMAEEGELTSDRLINAIESQSSSIKFEFEQMPLTVGRATQQVRNALLELVGGVDTAEGASRDLAEAIQGLADVLGSDETKQGLSNLISGITQISQVAAGATGVVTKLSGVLRESAVYWEEMLLGGKTATGGPGLFGVGDYLRDKAPWLYGLPSKKSQEGTNAPAPYHPGIDSSLPAPLPGNPSGRTTAAANDVKQIKDRTSARREATEADREWFSWMQEVEAHESVAEAARMDRTNERLRLEEEKQEATRRASQSVFDLIADMEFEASLIGLTNTEYEKAIALRYAGAAATDEQRAAIGKLVEDMARAREASGDVDFLKGGAKDLFGTIVTDSARASDALNRFFDNLKARAADKLFEGLMSGFEGMAGGGGWAGFAQGFGKGWTGGGKAAGGPLQAGQGYLVGDGGGPELFVPGQSGRLHPIGGAAGGGANVKLEVINNGPPMRAEQTTTRAPDGSQVIRLVLNAVADDIAGGGRTAAAMKGRFNLREAG